MNRPALSANARLLTQAVAALGDLAPSLVLVGGCAVEFLITSARAEDPRPTDDVDVVVEAVTFMAYHAFESQLRDRGFAPDRATGAPICRWQVAGVKLDLLPSEEVLGFRNRWFPLAVQTSDPLDLAAGGRIRIVSAPVFVATKLEAFHDRGDRDYLESHDLEDLIAVVEGRASLADELRAADRALREYVRAELQTLLDDERFLTALPGHLPGDAASQLRLPVLIARLRALASG